MRPAQRHIFLPLLALTACLAPQLGRAEDAAQGARQFEQSCAMCHSLLPGKTKFGPPLNAMIGRPAGSSPGYSYSDALRSSGLTWTPDKLGAFLEDPRKLVPGTRMSFGGISDVEQRANLIAFLSQQH